ncbi:hypothetical protein ACVQG4_26450, partial [Escherichia coli]
KMPAFEWVHVQLHQQKGMISLSPPTICNSARKRRWATALLPSKAINKNGMSFPIPFPLLQTVGDDFSRRR